MISQLIPVWERLKRSLWGLPAAMLLVAAALALIATQIRIDAGSALGWWLYSGSAQQAPEFLSSLLGGMLTMTTLALSITMVVLTLAAQQLGPRVIHTFMSDWRTQAALGLLISTSVYLLLVLRAVQPADGSGGIPNLAVTIGTALVLVCVVALLVFVHHLARGIVADNVIERIGAALDKSALAFLPEKGARGAAERPDFDAPAGEVAIAASGYVQVIDYDQLVACAVKSDACLEILFRPGDLVLENDTAALVRPRSACTSELARAARRCVVIGDERSAAQDLQYSIRQLVEIALRGISSDLRDAFTALAVLDRLEISLSRIMERGAHTGLHEDETGCVRVAAPALSFDEIIDFALTQIRLAGASYPVLVSRLIEALGRLAARGDDEQRAVLHRHLGLTMASARAAISGEEEIRALEFRFRAAMERASRRGAGERLGAGRDRAAAA